MISVFVPGEAGGRSGAEDDSFSSPASAGAIGALEGSDGWASRSWIDMPVRDSGRAIYQSVLLLMGRCLLILSFGSDLFLFLRHDVSCRGGEIKSSKAPRRSILSILKSLCPPRPVLLHIHHRQHDCHSNGVQTSITSSSAATKQDPALKAITPIPPQPLLPQRFTMPSPRRPTPRHIRLELTLPPNPPASAPALIGLEQPAAPPAPRPQRQQDHLHPDREHAQRRRPQVPPQPPDPAGGPGVAVP